MAMVLAKTGPESGPGSAEGLREYRVRPGVARLYIAAGVLMCAAAGAVLVLQPADFGKTYINYLFYLVAVAIAVLSLIRFRTCRLTIGDSELYFYNGLVDVRHIPLDGVDHVEYNPQIRIRFFMRAPGKRAVVHRLPNVFSEEDTSQILGCLVEHGIRVEHIEKPTPESVSAEVHARAEKEMCAREEARSRKAARKEMKRQRRRERASRRDG